MHKILWGTVALVAIVGIVLFAILRTPEQPAAEQMVTYKNEAAGFSIRLPSLQVSTTSNDYTYKLDESYRYQALGPGKDIGGIKFTIPPDMASGTNLGMDSYLSVEQIPQSQTCSAFGFLEGEASAVVVAEGSTIYSVASTTGAAAGNRYEETVYAVPGTNSCVAVRYFIHYSAIENYPVGAVKEFDHAALIKQFDAIRRTLTIL